MSNTYRDHRVEIINVGDNLDGGTVLNVGCSLGVRVVLIKPRIERYGAAYMVGIEQEDGFCYRNFDCLIDAKDEFDEIMWGE